MRRVVYAAVLFLIFSLASPWTAQAATSTASADQAKQEPKKPLPKIDIKKITLEAAEKGVVPSGRPLIVLVEVKASEDFSGPFVVNLELKKGQEKQKFTEGIEKLKQGSNAFKWDLTGKPQDGAYVVSVEVTNAALKLKDKSSKMFRVGEKKTEVSGQTEAEEATEVKSTSSASSTKPEAEAVKTETTKPKTTKSKTTASDTTKTKTTKSQTTASQTKSSGTTKKSKTTKSSGEDEEAKSGGDGKEDKKEDENKPSVSYGLVGDDEENKPVGDITTSGANVKEVSLFDIKFKGQFTETSPGVYTATGTIRPDWSFDISLGGAGTITIDTKNKRIDGVGYIEIPVYGKVAQIQSLIVEDNPLQIKFKGVLDQTLKIPGISTDVQFLKGLLDFEVSRSRIAATATGGFVLNFSVKGSGVLEVEIASGGGSFSSAIPPKGFNVTGKMTVEVPLPGPVPPVKVDLEGTATLTKQGLSGTGKAAIFSIIDITKGDVDIQTKGKMIFKTQTGMFIGKVIEMNLLGQQMELDIPSVKLTAGLSQDLSIINGMLKIPGPVKGDLTIDGKQKLITVSGKAGFSIAPFAGDALGFGIKNFLVKVEHYDASNPEVTLQGDLYASLWTFAGFDGKVTNFVLDGKGSFMLPPGLKQLLDLEKISLPIKIDMKSGQVLGELGGQVAGLAIKHFPLEGPEILVKNDGVHLKGKIGIANVITIPLGDLVFKKDESCTTLSGDAGIGPFTLAEGHFTLPADNSAGIGFNGQMGIPGLAKQKLNGTIYRDGKLEFSSLSKIGFINVTSMSKLAVSKTGLHADTARFSLGLGGAAECALTFSGLDITPSKISGTATGSFTGVLGIGTSLSGTFSFDGQTVVLGYPDAVTLCGISVSDATLNISLKGVTGSGKISAAGKNTTVSITIENGIMKLKGPAGELIAEGMRIADQLADTTMQIASDEKETIEEDAGDTMENLSRMTEPWIKDMLVVVRAAKGVYHAIEKVVVDEIFARVKTALDHLKEVVDVAVAAAKKAIDAAVDGVCDGIIALIDGVKSIFSGVESVLPAEYLDAYRTAKNKVIEKAAVLREKVVLFRNDTKGALYGLTSVITDVYQGAIDMVTSQANSAASSIKKQAEPVINEIDQLLTEVGQEIKAAKNAVGDEATRHYDLAKQKANLAKEKANSIIEKYKNKITDLVSPYIRTITDKLTPYADQVAKKRDEAIAKGIEGLATAKKTLDPYIQPFEDAVKEVKDFLSGVGGAAYQKFLEGIGAAGDALNKGLGVAGAGLVKATDLLGDGVVAASDAAANLSEAAHDAASAVTDAASDGAHVVASGASAAVNFAQETGSAAVNVAVNTAQQGYQTVIQAGNQVTQAAGNAYNTASSAVSSTASQAYATASQTYNNAQQQVSSTVSNVISHMPSISPSSFATGTPVSFSQIQSGAAVVSAKINSIVNTVGSYASSAYNAASSAASSAASTISSGASSASSAVSSGWNSAKGKVSSIFGSGGSAPPPPPPDYSAPTISNVSATSTTNSITVSWTTSVNARTLLMYKTQPDVNPSGGTAGGQKLASIHTGDNYPETTNHSITVTDLNPGTTYYYIVYSYRMVSGEASNVAKQGVYSIMTQPTTALVGGIVKDMYNNLLSGVKIYVDQVGATPVVTTGSSGEYSVELMPGTHTIIAKKDNFLSSSASTSSLSAGQIKPVDFVLADGKILMSGTVKDLSSGTAIPAATVTLTGPPTPLVATTIGNGAFAIAVDSTTDTPLQCHLQVAKAGYVSYDSGPLTLARGSKMSNIDIRLPHTPPALSSEGVIVSGVTQNQATISFTTDVICSAFVQFGPQSSSNYLYQTPTKTNSNSIYFDLGGLDSGTTYKYKVVLQDSYGNTVVAKENATFTTLSVTGRLTLKVLNGVTGQPVAQAAINVVSANGSRYTTVTNAIGTSVFTALPAGNQAISIGQNAPTTPTEASKTVQVNVVGNSEVTAVVYMSPTSAANIGLSASVTNITSNTAKLTINSTCKVLKHKLTLTDTTTNTKIIDQDLGVLVSPVPLDLTNLVDGHRYSVRVDSSLLADGTSGGVVKVTDTSTTFVTPALPDFVIQSIKLSPDQVKKGIGQSVNLSCVIKINHAITNATLKALAGTSVLYSQNFASYKPGTLQLTIPVAADSIPGTGKISLKVVFQAGSFQVQAEEGVNVIAGQAKATTAAQKQGEKPKEEKKKKKPGFLEEEKKHEE
jgi:hypothetical protein